MITFETYYLDNGLKVILHENLSIPKVAIDVLYRVGSRNENENLTGLAHLFEHLMFGGSKHIPEYDTPLQLAGGQNNAFTTTDITNYYLVLPANQIETGLWLESDRMLELAFSEKSLEVQKSVVIEEFKQRYLNQPYGDAFLLIRPVHFQVHPYRWATIGKEISHIEKVSLEDIKAFFYNFYSPANATLVIAGGVPMDEMKKLVDKWFGSIPYRAVHKPTLPVEPVQNEAKTIIAEREVPVPAFYRCYHVPERTHRHHPACDLLTDLLAHGKNSRLYKHFILKTRMATSINAYHWGAYDPGMITIEAKIHPSFTFQDFENELQNVFQELYETVDENEILRMNNVLETSALFGNTTVMNIAMNLAIYDSIGDPNLINTWQEPYWKIKPEDIRTVMDTYLKPENSTTLYYVPKS